MSRYFEQFYLFRGTAVFGAVMMAACFAAYGILFFFISGEGAGSGRFLFERVSHMVWFAVTLYGLVAAFLILVVGLFATNKVAGPLFRLEKMTEEAIAGKIPVDVQFREGDQIQPLARAQVKMFYNLADRERELAELGKRVEYACRDLAEGATGSSPGDWLVKVRSLRTALATIAEASRR